MLQEHIKQVVLNIVTGILIIKLSLYFALLQFSLVYFIYILTFGTDRLKGRLSCIRYMHMCQCKHGLQRSLNMHM